MKIKSTLLFLCLFLSMSVVLPAQDKFTGRITGVVSGDTITILSKDNRQIMLSLAGIEAPKKEQDYGSNAHQFLAALILDQIVTVSNIKEDCHKRKIASIAFNNKDLSLLAVKTGNAWADTGCEKNESMVKEELAAKEKKLGLWQNANPIKPSDFDVSNITTNTEKSDSTRRIFTGLAPTPPPPKNPFLHIGMMLEDFISVCGGSGKRSQLTSTSTRQHFSVEIAATPENIKKNCSGTFYFERESNAPYTMWMASQD